MIKQASRAGLMEFILLALIASGSAATCTGQSVEVPPPRMVLHGHQGKVDGIKPSADGKLLVSASSKGGTVRIWDLASGRQRRLFKQEFVGNRIEVWDIVSATERRLIAQLRVDLIDRPGDRSSRSKDRHQRQDQADDQPQRVLRDPITVVAGLSSDNRHLVMLLTDRSQLSVCQDELFVYALEGSDHTTIFPSGPGWQRQVEVDDYDISANGNILAYDESGVILVAGMPRGVSKIHLYDILGRRFLGHLYPDGLAFRRYTLSHDGAKLSAITQSDAMTLRRKLFSGQVTVWDARTGKKLGRVQTDGRKVDETRFSPDGQELAIIGGADYNTVFIADLRTWKIERTLTDFRDNPVLRRISILQLEYTPDRSYLMARGAEGTLFFWGTKDYRETLWTKPYRSRDVCVVFSPDGRKMIATGSEGDEPGAIKVWGIEQFLSSIPKVAGKAEGKVGGCTPVKLGRPSLGTSSPRSVPGTGIK